MKTYSPPLTHAMLNLLTLASQFSTSPAKIANPNPSTNIFIRIGYSMPS